MTRTTRARRGKWQLRALGAAIASLGMLSGTGHAMQFDTANPDIEVRWDNNFKYNLMMRGQDIDKDVTDSASPALFDDADLGWDNGDIVSNRLDLLSELEVVWKQNLGFRVSASAWYDLAYGDENSHPGVNKDFRINGNYTDTWGALTAKPGDYMDKAKDQVYKDLELYDAFAFANFTVGDADASVRAGRHTIYWGQSLLIGGAIHGIAGSMAPIDLAKGFGVPGTEARELFLPTTKLSGTLQLTQNVSLVGYYSLEFRPTRYPAPGTYLSLSEISTDYSEYLTLIAGQVDPVTGALISPRTGFVQNSSEEPDSGEWGIGAQFVFPDSGLEMGVYYLRYYDKYPHGIVGAMDVGQQLTFAANSSSSAAALVGLWPVYSGGELPNEYGYYTGGGYPAIGIGRYKWTYNDDNQLFGLSFGKEIWDISFGLEFVYRKDVAINFSQNNLRHTEPYPNFGTFQPTVEANLLNAGFPTDNFDFDGADQSNYMGPTGDTWHVIFNGVAFMGPGRFWDGGSWAFEFTAAGLESYGKYSQYANPNIKEVDDLKDIQTAVAINFAPQWYQVVPSLDVRLPLSVSYGIRNHSPISTGGNEEIGTGSAGLSFEYSQVWIVDLKYNFFFGPQDNGPVGNLKDRDNLTFTVKRTF